MFNIKLFVKRFNIFSLKYLSFCLVFFLSMLVSKFSFAGGIEQPKSPWQFYLGGFGGHYTADFLYNSRYIVNESSLSEGSTSYLYPFANDSFQQGGFGGAQLGFNYYISDTYFLGLLVAYQKNGDQAYLTQAWDLLPFSEFFHQFQFTSVWQLAFLIGSDITSRAHFYGKMGIASNQFKHRLRKYIGGATPSPFSSLNNQNRSLYGWEMGIGFSYDITSWLSFFSEYNYYTFTTKHLDFIRGSYSSSGSNFNDALFQSVRPTNSDIRLGFNLQFLPNYHFIPSSHSLMTHSIIGYIGGFGGFSRANFLYRAQANYPNQIIAASQSINNDTFQSGFSGGGQIGFLYYLSPPYFIGLNASVVGNSQESLLSRFIDVPLDSGNDITYATLSTLFKINPLYDVSAILGADVTHHVHIYTKMGAGLLRLKSVVNITQGVAPPVAPPPFRRFRSVNKDSFWGWLFGIGLSRDLFDGVELFAEYDLYGLGRKNLRTLIYDFSTVLPIAPLFQYNQFIKRIIDSTFRIGFNFKFCNHSHFFYDLPIPTNKELFYFGLFSGHYNADFQYQGKFLSQVGDTSYQFAFANDAFQRGNVYGARIGFQHHLNRPIFLGVDISGMGTAYKAKLVVYNIGTRAFSSRFSSLSSPLYNEFRIRSDFDFDGILGADFTRSTQGYIKIGASTGHLDRLLKVSTVTNPISFVNMDKKNLWGLVLGVGVMRSWSDRWRGFIEYDQYRYSSQNLSSFNKVMKVAIPAESNISGGAFPENVKTSAWVLRLGIDVLVPI